MLRFFLTLAVTLSNLIVFGFSFALATGTPPFEGALVFIIQLVFPWVFGLLSLINIIVVWRWRSSPSRPFSALMRGLRLSAWVLNISMTVIIAIVALVAGKPAALAVGAPWILALVALQWTREGWFEAAQIPAATRTAADVIDDAAYYLAHKVEIDSLRDAMKEALVDRHGFQPVYLEKIFTRDGQRLAIAAHRSGESAQSAARAFFSHIYNSPEANNPEIFARHVETGEALPPDYDYQNWRERFLGRSGPQHVISLVTIVFGLAFFYGFYWDTFLPSPDWRDASFVIALSLSLLLGARWLRMWKDGRIAVPPKGRRKYRKWDVLWMVPGACGLIWIMIYVGVGSVMTAGAGVPVQMEFAYKKVSGKPCVHIKETGAFNLARKCLKPEDYRALGQSGRMVFEGRQSWFGVSIETYRIAGKE